MLVEGRRSKNGYFKGGVIISAPLTQKFLVNRSQHPHRLESIKNEFQQRENTLSTKHKLTIAGITHICWIHQ